MKANHLQWQISDHPRAPIQFQELYLQNYGSRCDSKSIKFKITCLSCFVYATQFSTLFYAVSTGFYTVFVPAVFLKNTHLGALDDLHHCWRRNMSTQSFIEGCVCDLTKRFPHHGIYLIHNCILSNRVKSLWDTPHCRKTTFASFRDALQTNSSNHTVPRHKGAREPKDDRTQNYCSLLQKAEIPETAEIPHNWVLRYTVCDVHWFASYEVSEYPNMWIWHDDEILGQIKKHLIRCKLQKSRWRWYPLFIWHSHGK